MQQEIVMNAGDRGSEGEQFVNEIAYKSFIRYWCYAGPKDEGGTKKGIRPTNCILPI